MNKLLKSKLVLPLIILFGFLLRIWDISSNPPSLNWDEVSHGYNAFSILQTGKDEWGKSFPLIFRAFGDYKLPVYIYLTIIPVSLLGLNPLSVRLVSILAGTFAIWGIYLLTKILFKKQHPKASILAALFIAISPWHFFISRPALEANLALTFIIFATWAFLRALKNPRYYSLSAILFSLSLHTYNTARVFVPLFVLSLFLIYRKKITLNKHLFVKIILFTTSFALIVFQVLSGSGAARYQKLAILSDINIYSIEQSRNLSSLPDPLLRLLHNRPVFFVQEFTKNYFSYFSPQFLYQAQGPQYQFAIPLKNLFTLPITILALVGFVYLLTKIKSPSSKLLLAWLFLAPVAAALTADPPQALRPTPMIPVVIILASLGLLTTNIGYQKFIKKSRYKKLYSPFFVCIVILSTLFSFSRYLHSYWSEYRLEYAQSWQYGYQQAVEYIQKNQDKYERVIFTKRLGEPHIFYAFYSELNPTHLQPGGVNNRFYQSGWYWTDQIDNVFFVNDWEIPASQETKFIPLESGDQIPTQNALLITSPDRIPSNTQILRTISTPDGTPVFVIVEFE